MVMDEWLTPADAARLLGVVPATVRQMERDGRLPAQRTAGGMRLFRRDDVERMAEERAQRQSAGVSPPEAGSDEVPS
jgi:excisionase family DNA binding protein